MVILEQQFAFKVVSKRPCILALAIGCEGRAAVDEQALHGGGVRGGGRFHQGCVATDCGGVDELAYLLPPLSVLGGEAVLGKHHRPRVDEDLDRLVVPGSGREVEGDSTNEVVGHEVLGVPVVDLAAADECEKQLAIRAELVVGWNDAGNLVD